MMAPWRRDGLGSTRDSIGILSYDRFPPLSRFCDGDVYYRAGAAMEAIDDMAEALVGDRQFFLSERFPS